jgi:predicted permease
VGWRAARRWSAVAYREVTFQAIYGLRAGNILPKSAPGELLRTTERRVLQSKAMVGGLLALMGLAGGLALSPRVEAALGPFAPPGVYAATLVTGVLLLQLSFLWTTGLQILPTFLGSRVIPLLETLPLPRADRDRTAFLLFLRLFDVPALAVLLVTPIAFGWGLGSALAGLAVVPGVVASVLLAFGLALATAFFFVRRVQGAPAGAGATALRWVFLVLWAAPAFAIYAFVSLSPSLLAELTALSASGSPALPLILAVFPFPYGVLPVVVARGPAATLGFGTDAVALLLAAAAAYAVPLALLAEGLLRAPRRYALALPEVAARRAGPRPRLASRPPVVALVLKDLRIASRSPAFAFIILLPLLDALVLGLSTYIGAPSSARVFSLGAAAVATAALLATFFGPAFFATEVMGYSYTRTLPLAGRSLLAGKVGLIVLIYGLSSALVLAFTLARVFAPLLFLAFVLAELPGLVAAALLELGLLYRISERRGLTVTNLYTGAWYAALVVIPGLFVAGIPLGVFLSLQSSFEALGVMALVALGELLLIVPVALRWTRRGR